MRKIILFIYKNEKSSNFGLPLPLPPGHQGKKSIIALRRTWGTRGAGGTSAPIFGRNGRRDDTGPAGAPSAPGRVGGGELQKAEQRPPGRKESHFYKRGAGASLACEFTWEYL